jgi:hypothetical protein
MFAAMDLLAKIFWRLRNCPETENAIHQWDRAANMRSDLPVQW